MKKEKITRSFQGRILVISMIGLAACVLSCYLVSRITVHSIEQNQLEESLRTNVDNEINHLEFCYFTMVRMMQQLGEEGGIGAMLEQYLEADNNFEKYQRKRDLENEILSVTSVNNYVSFAIYIDSDTKMELFGREVFDIESFYDTECMTRIGENQFQALHYASSKYNDGIVVSMLRERQRFDGRTLDIYIEMKSNLEDYEARGGQRPDFPAAGRGGEGAVLQQQPVPAGRDAGAGTGQGGRLLRAVWGLLPYGETVRDGIHLCERDAPGGISEGDYCVV